MFVGMTVLLIMNSVARVIDLELMCWLLQMLVCVLLDCVCWIVRMYLLVLLLLTSGFGFCVC